MSKITFILFALIGIFFSFDNLLADPRVIEIYGTKMYTPAEIIASCNLQDFIEKKINETKAIERIYTFYIQNGYTIAKIYTIHKDKKSLKIYIDEGKLGKIIFLNMDDFTIIYLKFKFRLKNKIFNINTVNENIEALKKDRGWADITYNLKPIKNYDKSLLQLNRLINIPILGKTQLPFLDRYSHRYDMVILISKNPDSLIIEDYKEGYKDATKDKEHDDDTKKPRDILNKFDFGLKIHYYKGLIPYLRYSHLSLFAANDLLDAEVSLGVMYGIDGRFKEYPRLTFYEFDGMYYFKPAFKDVFTPHIKTYLYQSNTSRLDLGLLRYGFLLFDAMFAPGITILRKYNFYTGIGVETVYFDNSKVDSSKLTTNNILASLAHDPYEKYDRLNDIFDLYKDIEKRTDVYMFAELGIKIDFSKTKYHENKKNRLKKEILIKYSFFFLEDTFHKLRVFGIYDHEFSDRSIYSGGISYIFLYKYPPFHHESPVSADFRGFMGSTYHSRNKLSQSNEYRISLYQDYLYVGLFFDMTLFEGSGYDLTGPQFGFAGGPTIRFLFLDHFELYLYYGWDYLISTRKNSSNFYFNIYNKW